MLSLLLVLSVGAVGEPLQIRGVNYRLVQLDTGPGESHFHIADLDRDGLNELIVSVGSEIHVFAFRNGAFARVQAVAAGANADEFDVGLLDADDYPDIVVANHETEFLTLISGSASGLQPHDRLPVHVDPHPHVARILDINNDDLPDILVDDRNGEGLRILQGKAHWQFEDAGLISTGGDPYRGFAAGDLNRDGWIDLVSPNADRVAVVMNRGESFLRSHDVAASAPFAVELADVNQDGHADLIVADDGAESQVRIHQGDGSGAFPAVWASAPLSRGGKDIAVGDVNMDGIEDVLVVSWNTDAILMLGNPDKPHTLRLPVSGNPWGVAIGDINGDGLADLVVGDGVDHLSNVWLTSPPTARRFHPLRAL